MYRRTFVGREQELRQLHAAFDAGLSGRGSLAMVVGEPGIGKTSVCEQLATYAALRGGKHLIGHCYEEGSLSLPYLPFVEAMRSYVLTREPADLRKELGSGASEVARIVSEVRDKVQVSPSDGGDPEEQRWRLLQAVTGFLRNASMVQPLLLVLEDLHDADRGTLDLLLHLSRNLEGARLLIVGTYRDVEVDRAHPLSAAVAELRRSGSFLRIPLRGLTVDEVHRMYEALRGQSVQWAQAELVHRQTEGNPLFVQEVLRYLVEEGVVVRESGRYNIRPEDQANPANIPEGLRDVVGRRLNRLSEKANQVLSIAAVIGREFRLDVLQKVAGLPEDDLYAAVEEAQERAIIEQRQVFGIVGFRFTHAFFRQTLYEEMFAPRRIRWHQQIGHALEEVHARRLEEHAAELAEHFAQSTEAPDLEKALHYCELAAQRAMKVFAYSEAVRQLEQALRTLEILDPDDKSRRCDLLLALAESLSPAGQTLRAAKEIAEEAFNAAVDLDQPERMTQSCRIALGALYRYAGVDVRLMPEWRTWAERADRHTQPGTLARVYADLALVMLKIGSEDVLAASTSVLQAARQVADNEALFQCAAVAMLGGAPSLETWSKSFDLAEEFSVRSRDGVATYTLVQVLSHCASYLLAWGNRDRAEEIWNEIRGLAQHTKDPYVLLRPVTNEITIRTLDGQLEMALAAADRLVSSGEESGSAVLSERAGAYQGLRPRLYLGRAQEALETLTSRPAGRRALPFAYLQRNADALSALRGASPDFEIWNAATRIAFLETAVLLEDEDLAATLILELEPLAHLICSRGQELTAFGRHVGAAARLLGRPTDARAYYNQALEVCEKVRFRPEIALIRLELAELLLEHYPDERAQAIEQLDFAIGEFREMKMQPSLERALRHRGLLKA